MTRKVCICFVCVFLLTLASASVLKEALEEHLKDVAHNEGAESIKHDKHKGENLHEIDTQIGDTHKNQFSKSSDEGKYLKKDHDSKTATDSDSYKGYNSKQDKAEDSATTGYKRGHKKGHHNQGFKNSYHKDESSNKSTFFDDSNDEGDEAAYNSRLNNHDNYGGRSYQGSHNNGQEYVRDNYHGGGHDRYADVGNKHQGHQDHGRKYYLDDAHDYNKYLNDRNRHNRDKVHDYYENRAPHHRDPGWDSQRWDDRRGWDNRGAWDDRRRRWDDRSGWEGHKGWERPGWQKGWDYKDYDGPGYYDDHGLRHSGGYGYGPNHGYGYGFDESRSAPIAQVPLNSHNTVPLARNAPVVAQRKQTITIYEDPRYGGKQNGQLRREEGDHLQLEFRPSSQRYAEYDDTYYAPTRDGGVETSKINRLVYNYRRQ